VSWLTTLLNVLLVLTSIFLILLILIQRGKGGGLAGAFGGVGGSSAFGTKAGDVFTKITIRTALVWFLLNMLLVYGMSRNQPSLLSGGKAPASASKGDGTKSGTPDVPAPVLEKGTLPPAGKGTAGSKAGAGLPPVEVPRAAGPDAPLPTPIPPPGSKGR
jgi:preprotein translocase subunit SecG